MSDKRIKQIFILFGVVFLCITFGKLYWVKYYASIHTGVDKDVFTLIVDTIPIFIIVVCVGLVVGWIRNRRARQKSKGSD